MFIERDKEKECSEMSSSSRYHIKNYYEIHRTNLFGVNKKTSYPFEKHKHLKSLGCFPVVTKCLINSMEKYPSN